MRKWDHANGNNDPPRLHELPFAAIELEPPRRDERGEHTLPNASFGPAGELARIFSERLDV